MSPFEINLDKNIVINVTNSKSKLISFLISHRKLSDEQRNIPDALLAFNVKVSEMLGLSQRHVGECFIRLDQVPVLEADRDINSIDVQQLFLTMPENIGNIGNLFQIGIVY